MYQLSIIITLLVLMNIMPYCYASDSHNALLISKQLILVTVPNVNDFHATLRFYQRDSMHGAWKLYPINGHSSIRVVIGAAGLAWSPNLADKPDNMRYKKEGDNRTPAGIFTLPGAFGKKENHVNPTLPYIDIDKHTVCVDDVNSKFYNKIIDKKAWHVHPDWKQAEQMYREMPMYQLGLQIAYNPANISGYGSCIFMHQWRSADSGTAGCIAMDYNNLKYLIMGLRRQDNPVLVQLPEQIYPCWQTVWKLPPSSN